MTIKLKYSDEPIEVTGMSFDEDGVFKGYFKEGDPATPVKTDEFYPKEDCDTVNGRVYIPEPLTWRDIDAILNIDMDYQNEMSITGDIPLHEAQMKEVLRRYLQYKQEQLFNSIISRLDK